MMDSEDQQEGKAEDEHLLDVRPVNILVGVSGSVATIKLRLLVTQLAALNAHIKIVATDAATRFFDPSWDSWEGKPEIYGNEDDWRSWSKVGDEVVHISLRKWADILLIAPLSANTLAKIAQGYCDNLLTCVVRAWDTGNEKPIFLAPAMNTYMWLNPFTEQHLSAVSRIYHATIIPPVEKTLACGDTGNGAMAHVEDIVRVIQSCIGTLQAEIKL